MTPDPEAFPAPSATNLSSPLDFLVERAIRSQDAAQCYAEPLIEAAAAGERSDAIAACDRLKKQFGKDFSAGPSGRWWVMYREALARLNAQATPASHLPGLICSDNGAPKPILANAITALAASPLKIGFDSFSNTITHQIPSPWATRGPWRDRDDVETANLLQHQGVLVSSALAHEAVYKIAQDNPYHPVRDWLSSLKWDGEPRLDTLASVYFGCADTPYARQVSQFWPISAVARILRPGCIAKYMIVLEGAQDEGKSKALRALVNGHLDGDSGVQWFRDNMPDLDHKDIGMYMQGVWIIEAAELSAIRGKEWERTKSFISSPRDTFRMPWGRNMQDYPRQCVFAGTTNEDEWGGDQTGLVRFWPLRAGKLDVAKILEDRDQLWAEAKFLYDEGRPWFGDREFDILAHAEQGERAPEDAWRDSVLTKAEELSSYDDWIQMSKLVLELNVPYSDRDRMSRKFGAILRAHGWKKSQQRVEGYPRSGYLRPGATRRA